MDFALPSNVPLDLVVPVIKRDRAHMAKRPGFRQKHLPIRVDSDNAKVLSGGRYLLDTFEHAEDYKRWIENDFTLDGVKFFDRPVFLDPSCHVWRVVGGHEWAEPASQPTTALSGGFRYRPTISAATRSP